jgi:hypothetical protein
MTEIIIRINRIATGCLLTELSPSWEAAHCTATQELPCILWTRRFIIVFTRALHWSLSWARSIQSISSHPVSLRSILILSAHLRLGLPSDRSRMLKYKIDWTGENYIKKSRKLKFEYMCLPNAFAVLYIPWSRYPVCCLYNSVFQIRWQLRFVSWIV